MFERLGSFELLVPTTDFQCHPAQNNVPNHMAKTWMHSFCFPVRGMKPLISTSLEKGTLNSSKSPYSSKQFVRKVQYTD